MKKNSILYIIIITLLAAVMYLIIAKVSPNMAVRLPVFLILIALESWFFLFNRKFFFSKGRFFGWVVTSLYWLPLLLIVLFVIGSAFKHFVFWNDIIRIYLVGLIFILFFSQLLPLGFFIIDRLVYSIRRIFIGKMRKKQESNEQISRRSFIQKAGWIAGGLMFSSFVYGMIDGVYNFKIFRLKINSKKIPSAFNGLKIVQISDLHLGSWASKKKLEEVVQMINELKADIFVFTGDLVDYRTEEAWEFEEILKKIKVRLGKFSILGNHDYGEYFPWENDEDHFLDQVNMAAFHKKIGWDLLLNKSRVISINGQELQIIGVENWGDRGRFVKRGDLELATKNVKNVPFKILLSHDPSHWEYKVLDNFETIDLTLSGHTHGGQFGIETAGIKWSLVKVAYDRWAGLYTEQNSQTGEKQQLYVNRGIGTIGFPGRVGIRPEITLIELKRS